ncbi:general substrate transporter, partial [Rhizodiscina lignyota]
YDQGVFSGLLQNPHWLAQFKHPSDSVTGITVGSYCLGSLVGCGINFAIGDMLGRRRMIWLAMCFILVGATLQTSAFKLAHLIVGRIITGFGTGIDSSTVPMYQSELSRKEWRGRLVSWEIWFIGVGIVLAYWVDYGFSYVNSAAAWRTPIAIQLIFAIIVVFVVWGLPESPRWLAKRGREDEAHDVLCAVFDLPHDDPYVASEIEAIRAAIALETHEGTEKVWSVFKKDVLQTRKRVILAWFGLFMNQMGGINLVVYYMPSVLVENVGLARNTSLLIAGFVELMFIVGNTLPALALDRMGRKMTMLIGAGLLSFCMMMITILLSFGRKDTSSAAIAFFFLFMLIFGATINVVPWVYGPEILPLEARTRGTAISVSAHWLWNFFIVMITPVLINRIGYKTYILFTCTNAAFVPIIWYFYPETGNMSLEDIDSLFLPEDMQN